MKKIFSKEVINNIIFALAAQNPYFVKYYAEKEIEVTEKTNKVEKAA